MEMPSKGGDTKKIIFSKDRSLELEYIKFGHGTKAMLCFHGFGLDAFNFKTFESFLANEYTFYSVNLFFHGNSNVKNRDITNEPLTSFELNELIETLLKTEKIDQFSLLAYSIGGKIALKIAELMPARLSALFLFAPDGIVINPWYKIASKTKTGRWIYRSLMKHHNFFKKTVSLFTNLKVINSKMKQLALKSMETPEKRQRAYNVWVFLRNMESDIPGLKKKITQFNIPVEIYVGEYDKILNPSTIKQFENGLNTVKIRKLKAGHVLFKKDLIKQIIEAGGLSSGIKTDNSLY